VIGLSGITVDNQDSIRYDDHGGGGNGSPL